MADRDTVEMVRLEQPERLFDVEAVLGRDTGSVFPSAAKNAALVDFAASTAASAPKFVTEAELEKLKALRGGSVEDGTASADRPLHEVLRENKEKKDAEFQDKWRLMKQGQNKPLEEDEVAFLDTVAQQGVEHERAQRAAVDREVQSFQLMREQVLLRKAPEPAVAPTSRALPAAASGPKPRALGMLRPAIVAISKDNGLPLKRPRASDEQVEEPPVKSLGLLAQYGSDEDDS